jgi:hypothetical protein
MANELPPSLLDVIQACPLEDQADLERLLCGDLPFGARRYAARAGYFGDRGDWWRVWWEIERARGLSLSEALEELSCDQLFWYARWSFGHGEVTEGLVAYRRYLDHPRRPGRRTYYDAMYLDHLLQQGRYADVLDTVQELVGDEDDAPEEGMRTVRAAYCLGDEAAALERLAAIRERHHDDGNVWALTAVLSAEQGNAAVAQESLTECLKLGVYDRRLEGELLKAVGLSLAEWQSRRAPFLPSPTGYDEERRHWWTDPGARLKPTEEVSPHWYGGDEFRMPDCLGCGHPIRQWFLLDLREIEPLRERLPSWRHFPLLGCTDCSVWVGRHDYEVEVEPDAMIVRLVNVATSLKRFGEAIGTLPEIPRGFARLEWVSPRLHPTDKDLDGYIGFDRPQVAGRPAWVQDALRVYCRTCRQEMAFIAAMATTNEFEPVVLITNGDGFLYHFACDRCHTISVIAQNT